jgi:hypothetical protein
MRGGLLRQSLRILQLPIRSSYEVAGGVVLSQFLRQRSIRYSDVLTWTLLELGIWKDSGNPSIALRQAVNAVLAADPTGGQIVTGQQYFMLHARLQDGDHGLGHDESTAFLSHMNLAITLVQEHRFTAARLSQVLSQIDSRVSFRRYSLTAALDAFGLPQELTSEQVDQAYNRDQSFEGVFFADSDLVSGADIAARAAQNLGFKGDLETLLLILAPTEDQAFMPYIQTLHCQCMILEYFDHSVIDMYEFSPRGRAMEGLFKRYPPNLVATLNPVLNNFKAVGTITSAWADFRKESLRPKARALFALLSLMNEMSYTARRELAMIVRCWIMLFLRLSGGVVTQLPAMLTANQVNSVITFIRSGNTSTLGILEQRLVDALASLRHSENQWIQRGRGDAVNATNMSQRKLGDCDFQNRETKTIFAYEAHGGALTDVYLRDHRRTLQRVVPLRKPELEAVGDINEWSATIRFIAHGIYVAPPEILVIDGLRINFELFTFNEFLDSLALEEGFMASISEWFLPPLRARRTPESVRLKLLEHLS